MTTNKVTTQKKPVHPGGYVKHKILAPLGLTVTESARALGVTRPALSALLNERAQLSPEMALRIEKAFGASMELLMQMQNGFDIAQVRARANGIKVRPYRGREAGGSSAHDKVAVESALKRARAQERR